MSMRSHISHAAASCFSAMRQIRSIRRSLPSAALEMLVTSLVHSRLDYCNLVFAGLPACDIRRLQSFLNSSVRLVSGSRIYDHVTSLLRDHHWLTIAERIEYKLSTLVSRCLQGNTPRYLADIVVLTSSVGRRSGLRSADTLTLEVSRTRQSFGDTAFCVTKDCSRPACLEQSSHTCFSRPRRTFLQRRDYARRPAATSSFLRRGFDSVIAPSRCCRESVEHAADRVEINACHFDF